MEKNNQSVDIKSLSKEQRAALMAQLQQEEKEDRIARRETYEALRGEFMHEVKTNVLEMVNAVTGFRGWLEKEADAFTKVMKEYGQVKSDEQRSYTITDGDFRLEVKSNKVKGFDERADMAAFEGGYDLWKMNLRKKETKLLHKMDAGWADMQLDKDGKNLFLLGSRKMQKMDTSSDALTPITFQVDAKMDLAAEREYMFDHVYRQQQKRFYNTNMHGVDWEKMTAAYRRFLPHIDNNYDFAELLSEWLGELNVSHTGGRFYPKGQSEPTASLGLFFDWNYTGRGMLIAEVVEKGPFDTANTRVKAGTVIEKIDGVEITPDADYYTLLNNKARKKTLVSLFDPQTKEHWEEVIIPITNGAFSDLLYSRWVKQRAADVDRWSGGRLGYVHIESMGDDSFRSVYSDILGKYNNREGIVIDTRFNGGGRLHEDIEILFSGQKYFTQVVRGREACDMPSRRWNKPSIMVMCEANYSNAHGTPWVYSHRGIGKLVGMPVPGTMTSVSWERLQDPSLVFGIPVVGYRLPDGSYLENSQLEPDIKVANSPETIVKGEDTQLKAAVEELLKELEK